MKIYSTSFENGGTFPLDNTGKGKDLNPDFTILDIDSKAKSLVLFLDDMSIPFICPYNHWVMFNIPIINQIPSGLPKGRVLDSAIQGNAYGKNIYRGPKPPFGRHMYVFSLYSLDEMLDLDERANSLKVQKKMKSHIIDSCEYIGYFK